MQWPCAWHPAGDSVVGRLRRGASSACNTLPEMSAIRPFLKRVHEPNVRNCQHMTRRTGARWAASPDSGRRRFVLAVASGVAACISARALASVAAQEASSALPKRVAGVSLPDTPLALAATDLAHIACPPFLFNHCMRTYVFGALFAARDHVTYDEEMIFIAATLHDVGLTTTYATPEHSFEMDGADAAKAFLVSRGVAEARAEVAWNAIALHTSMLAEHQAPQVALVGNGAGADVFGYDLKTLSQDQVQATVSAFPRLSFNKEFRDLLIDHCHRKPFAQRGTWLDVFCRAHNPGVPYGDLDKRLLEARVPE
jgi:HD domain-containing protein